MNVIHSSMKTIDEFYSNLNDREVQNRIKNFNANEEESEQGIESLIKYFLKWRQASLK